MEPHLSMMLLLLVGSLKEVTDTTLGTFFTSWMDP